MASEDRSAASEHGDSSKDFRASRILAYAAMLMLDLAGGIAFGWHFAVGGAAGAMTAFAWLWVNAR